MFYFANAIKGFSSSVVKAVRHICSPDIKFNKEFILFSVCGGAGLIGNSVNLLVLNSRDMRSNCFNNLLTSLNIAERYEKTR